MTEADYQTKVPDLGPLIEDLLGVATTAVARNSQQALDVWKQIAHGDYEPKHVLRDSATLLGHTTKDFAKAAVAIRRFMDQIAADDEVTPSK